MLRWQQLQRTEQPIHFGFLLVFLALGATVVQSQGSTAPQLTLEGRFSPGNDSQGNTRLPQTFSWPASSASVAFSGASAVHIEFQGLPSNQFSYGVSWFRFFIDGQQVTDDFTTYNKLNLAVTIPTSLGSHTLKITKMNEGKQGEAMLNGISLSSGSFLPAPALSQKRILIFGDSYAVGYGDAGAGDPVACDPTSNLSQQWTQTCTALQIVNPTECVAFWKSLNENSDAAFGPVTARAFNADFQLVAAAGVGLIGYSYAEKAMPGLSQAQYQTMYPAINLLLNRSQYSQASSQWSLTSWIPQVIIMAAGTNDWNSVNSDYSMSQWALQATNFLQMLSNLFNNPLIIIQVYHAEPVQNVSTDARTGFEESQQYEDAMSALYAQTQAQNLRNIQLLTIQNLTSAAWKDWCDDHPSAAAHAGIASQLSEAISSSLGWAAGSIDQSPSQSVLRPDISKYTGGPAAYSPLASTFSPSGSAPAQNPPLPSTSALG